MDNATRRSRDAIELRGDLDDFDNVWTDEPYFIPTVTVYGIAFVVGIIGNALVVFAVLGDRKNRGMTASLMVSLAVADLLFLSVCVPYETSRYFSGNWIGGQALCKISGFVQMLTAVATIANLTAIGVERYVVIVYPMKTRLLCTKRRNVLTVIAVWITATCVSLPNFFVMSADTVVLYNNLTTNVLEVVICAETGITTDENRIYFTIYQLVVMLLAPTVVMTFCYAAVIYALWHSTRHLALMTTTPERSQSFRLTKQRSQDSRIAKDQASEAIEVRKQLIKMLVTVIVVFILCWGPKLVFAIMRRLRLDIVFYSSAHTTMIVLDCLPYVQSCLNPIIYGFMSQNFRRSMRYACIVHVKNRIGGSNCTGYRRDAFDIEMSTGNGSVTAKTQLSKAPSRRYDTPLT